MRKKVMLLIILNCGNSYLFGQFDCQDMLSKAMVKLPEFYREKSMDSLDNAVTDWESHCTGKQEVRITRLLLNIEEDKFSITKEVDSSLLLLLNSYAINFPSPQNQELPEKLFYRFSIAWAKLLLKNKKLDDNEKFICNVLIGDIYDPQREIEKNTARYPEFTAMLGEVNEDYRRGTRTNIAISTGLWRPTKNLSTLGIHPSAGLHIGARNFHHELDLTLQFRFSKSANEYTVDKGGYSITSDSYLGGYIGLDYNYYLVSKSGFEFGLIAGIGYDGFDVDAPVDANDEEKNFTSIGSLNANTGLRFNFYYTHARYIALQGRYNMINYTNPGGTDFSGDAFSIDLIFGFQGKKQFK